jgi:hypothetical protein
VAGRDFSERDRLGAPDVAIVNAQPPRDTFRIRIRSASF